MRLEGEIHHHGNIERLIREEAARWGWNVEIENVGVDPEGVGFGRHVPGRADVTLSRDGNTQTFSYELPEDSSDIVETVRRLVRADELERARRSSAGG